MGNVLLRYHRGALFWGQGGLDLSENRFDIAIGSGSLRSRRFIIPPGLKNAANLIAKFDLFVAKFSSFSVVLIANCFFFLFLDVTQLTVHFFGGRRQFGIHQPHPATGFIDQIDGLIRKEAITDVAIPQGGGGN